MEQPVFNSFRDVIKVVLDYLNKNYWEPIYLHLEANPDLVKTVPGFLVSPKEVIFYFGRTHLGIEYTGEERLESLPERGVIKVKLFDYTKSTENYLQEIIGFEYNDGSSNPFLVAGFLEDLIMPTNRGFDKLAELGWHIEAQDSMTVFNASSPILIENQFVRIINGLFFDTGTNGLRTRHIKWIDFVPIVYDETLDSEKDLFGFDFSPFTKLVEHDCNYTYPLPENYDYRHSKLQKINRLIQLAGNNETQETDITQFLSKPENQFILTMRFGAKSIASEKICYWQSTEKDPIKPDFFVVQTNGFADIVEFKLPSAELGIVGKENRESFSSQVNSYVSQTRTYRNYFDDPNNRAWFEQTYNFKVYRPRRILVIGRRWQFDIEIWKEIVSDYQDLEILTYDDLVDGVVAQLYM